MPETVPPLRLAVLEQVADRVPDGPVQIGIDGVDDFLHPPVFRYRRGRHDPEGFFLDSFDLDAFLAAARDARRTDPLAVVVVDGLFLQRDELAGRFDLVVFLDVPFAVTAARMAVRDGTPADPDHPQMRRYVEGQRIYFRRCRPRERADVVIEHSDPLDPVVTQDRRLPS